MTIWKFPLKMVDAQAVPLPNRSQVLTVQMQGNGLSLWALVDPELPVRPRRFFIVGTGNPMPNSPTTYIGTVQDRSFVWHVFMESR